MKLRGLRPFISTSVGLLCGWLIGSTVTLLAHGVGAGLPSQTADTQPCPAMNLETPASSEAVGLVFHAAGWAADLGADSGTGVDAVHVWAYPASGSPLFVGVASYGGSRPDVGAFFGSQFTDSAFDMTVTGLPIGTYTLVTFAHSTITGTFNQSRSVTVTVTAAPAMSLDAPAQVGTVGSSFYAAGWAIDRAAASGTGVDAVHVWAYPKPGSDQSGRVPGCGLLRRRTH